MASLIQLSGCAIIEDKKLLLLYKKTRNFYELPGGKVERGESLEETAVREAKEEIGCDVKLTSYWGFRNFEMSEKHLRSHIYLARIVDGQMPRVVEKSIFAGLFWLPLNEYPAYALAPNVRMFCEEYIQGRSNL
ncbi:MAG: NUDIX hydrolase [Nanoarchaeota archaeon]